MGRGAAGRNSIGATSARARRPWYLRTWAVIAGMVLVVLFLEQASPEDATPDQAPTVAGDSDPAPSPSPTPTPTEGPSDSSSPTPEPTRTREPKAKPQPVRTYLVTRVVDGDTLELGNGETVRIVGIDAPESGECGFDAATARMAGLVAGRRVRLAVSDEDRDRYDRLLRYVDVGTTDAGLRLIEAGLAIARYDSRDGYGFHPREPAYVAADRASRDIRCAPVPLVPPAPPPRAGSGCAPGYTPCIPPYPPDLDCDDVDGSIRVRGSDPHGLDGEEDGTACES